jgi:hypothetical protein
MGVKVKRKNNFSALGYPTRPLAPSRPRSNGIRTHFCIRSAPIHTATHILSFRVIQISLVDRRWSP